MLGYMRVALVVMVAGFAGSFLIPEPADVLEGVAIVGPATAQAQEKQRRSLFSIIFGKPRTNRAKNVRKPRVRREKTSRRKTRSRSSASRSAVVVPAKPDVEKLEDAKVVLVVGDFFAGGLADGLKRRLADVPGIVVSDGSVALSGLVRDDIVRWPDRIAELVAETKPAYIVAMVGSNDRQLMRVDGKRLARRTEPWDAQYKERVNAVGVALKASGVPYTWVGLPPVRFNSMNGDFLVFNEWYAAAAASPIGRFVDIWDGFSDADGNYSRSGPDVSGQIVLLRRKDGINLTKAGRDRLAFYVEEEIKRVLDGGAVAGSGLSAGTGFGIENATPATPAYDPASTGRTVVVRLNDPASDGADVLAGETVDRAISIAAPPPVVPAAAGKTVENQRADNFRWPPVAGEGPPASPTSVASQ